MSHKLCVIPGDGIGPEVTQAALRVLLAFKPNLHVVPAQAGWDCFRETGTSVPDETLAAIRSAMEGRPIKVSEIGDEFTAY